MKAARVILPVLLFAAIVPAGGESLWSPDFKGYLSGSKGLAVGDALVVQIDASSSLSSHPPATIRKISLSEFTGGDSGNLFSFLPQVRTGGSLSTTGKDSLSLKTQVPVVVTAVNPDGTAQVQGSRTVTVQGKNESITVTGAVSRSFLDQQGVINFNKLANARLAYTTFLASAKDTLSAADLQRLLAPTTTAPAPATGTAAAPSAAGTAAAPAAGSVVAPAAGAAAAATGGTAAAQTGLSIPDARKKELLLLYLNRLIDIVFNQ